MLMMREWRRKLRVVRREAGGGRKQRERMKMSQVAAAAVQVGAM